MNFTFWAYRVGGGALFIRKNFKKPPKKIFLIYPITNLFFFWVGVPPFSPTLDPQQRKEKKKICVLLSFFGMQACCSVAQAPTGEGVFLLPTSWPTLYLRLLDTDRAIVMLSFSLDEAQVIFPVILCWFMATLCPAFQGGWGCRFFIFF